ncbi:MAG: transglycosylase SLT domain-containing protein [Dermatophilaceae bacterium]
MDAATTSARRHGVDPRLVLAISYQEPGWNHRAVSPANAIGVMQVIAASSQGLEGVRRSGMHPDTRRYVATVLHLRRTW